MIYQDEAIHNLKSKTITSWYVDEALKGEALKHIPNNLLEMRILLSLLIM